MLLAEPGRGEGGWGGLPGWTFEQVGRGATLGFRTGGWVVGRRVGNRSESLGSEARCPGGSLRGPVGSGPAGSGCRKHHWSQEAGRRDLCPRGRAVAGGAGPWGGSPAWPPYTSTCSMWERASGGSASTLGMAVIFLKGMESWGRLDLCWPSVAKEPSGRQDGREVERDGSSSRIRETDGGDQGP